MSPGRAFPASRSVRGPAEWRKLAETSNKEQNAYQHLYDLRTSGFESLFSDSHCWKTALAQAEFNGETLTKTVSTKAANKRGKSVQKIQTNLARTVTGYPRLP